MMLRLPFFVLLLAAGFVAAQSTPPQSPADKKFSDILTEVQRLSGQQQNEKALEKLREAEAIKPDSPVIQNARGSIYTSMKDYDKARECFTKATSISPDSFESYFNLTELDYVQGNYETASNSFTRLLASKSNLPPPIRSLVQFKIIVCQIKLKKVAEATELAKTYAFKGSDPASYYTSAAFAIDKGDNTAANEWLAKAHKAFQPSDTIPYLDALVEAHWISVPGMPGTKK